jgi:hypothetical protein
MCGNFRWWSIMFFGVTVSSRSHSWYRRIIYNPSFLAIFSWILLIFDIKYLNRLLSRRAWRWTW